MARIEKGIVLTAFDASNLGTWILNDGERKHIIITETKNVSVYNLSDYKCLHSWTVQQNASFTHKAVFDGQLRCYIAVQKDKNLLMWDEAVVDLSKVKPVVLSSAVHCLLAIQNSSSLVVFENGAVADLTDVLNGPRQDRQSVLQGTAQLKECITCCYGNQRKVFYLVHDKKVQEWCIYSCDLGLESSGNATNQWSVLQKPGEESSLVAYSMFTSEGSVHLITIWSSGDVCLAAIPVLTSDTHIKCQPLFNVESHTAVTWLGQQYVAVAGVKGLDKAQPDSEFLGIWDSTFGTLQAKRRLPDKKPDESKEVLVATEGSLLLMRDATISAYRYTCMPATLATALGCLRHLGAATDSITEQADWKPHSTKKVAEDICKKESLLKEVMNREKCKTEAQFAAACKNLLEYVTKDKFADSCYLTTLLEHVASRCIEEKNFWPSKSLLSVIKHCSISASSCQLFLNYLLEREDRDLLSVCLKHMLDVPEQVMVKALQIYLRNHDDSFSDDALNSLNKDAPQNPLTNDLTELLNDVLRCSYNDVFLLEHLRSLYLEEVLVLVQYLFYRLTSSNNNAELAVSIDWICLLLDSHYSALVMSSKAKTLLVQLHIAVEGKVQFSQQLKSLQSLLHPIINSKSMIYQKPKQNNGLYSIDVLRLW